MNAGERDEYLAIFTLLYARACGRTLEGLGKVQSVGKRVRRYRDWQRDLGDPKQLRFATDELIAKIATTLDVTKASGVEKADVHVNGIGVSLKSHRKAPPALVNHTTRPGWQFAARNAGVTIDSVDRAVELYWQQRQAGTIREDVLNDGPASPFWSARTELTSLLKYFMFEGTGTRLSAAPAAVVLEFTDPTDLSTWVCREPATVVDELWSRLVFSLRSDKGMPKNYPNVSPRYAKTKSSIARWTVYWQNEYRGALHVRVR
ncbi:MAG: hypothetical protein ACK5C3_09140 [bacterium]|jgi:hypothetical protein